MAGQDIESWAEVENATLDLKCVVPIYSTANVTKDSHTILETLAFDNNNSDYLQKARKYGHFTGYKN